MADEHATELATEDRIGTPAGGSDDGDRESCRTLRMSKKVNPDGDMIWPEIPLYYEMWTWEGDLEPLPAKWEEVVSQVYHEEDFDEGGPLPTLEKVLNNPRFDPQCFFFITTRGNTAGTAFALPDDKDPDVAHIHWLCVEESHRRLGVGKALVQLVVQRLQQVGKEIVVAETSTHNDEGIAFFLSCGFDPVINDDTDEMAWIEVMRRMEMVSQGDAVAGSV